MTTMNRKQLIEALSTVNVNIPPENTQITDEQLRSMAVSLGAIRDPLCEIVTYTTAKGKSALYLKSKTPKGIARLSFAKLCDPDEDPSEALSTLAAHFAALAEEIADMLGE